MDTDNGKIKVFLSYARDDIKIAERLYNELSSRNDIKVWFDKKSILTGQNWSLEIAKAIRDCSFFILLLSHNSTTKRGYIQKEIKEALEAYEYVPEGTIFILPARIESVTPPSSLKKLQYVDLFPSSNWSSGVQQLIKSVTYSFNKKKKIFFNYHENDIELVEKLHNFLEKNKIKFEDKDSFTNASSMSSHMEELIQNTDTFITLLSPKSTDFVNKSGYFTVKNQYWIKHRSSDPKYQGILIQENACSIPDDFSNFRIMDKYEFVFDWVTK